MATPRRRIIRPTIDTAPNRQPQLQKQRHRLEAERKALARWMTRLKRAWTFVDKLNRAINRIERKITQLENS